MEKRGQRTSLGKKHTECEEKSVGTNRRKMRIRCCKKEMEREKHKWWRNYTFTIVKILERVFMCDNFYYGTSIFLTISGFF